jgi:hypothetical protein
MKRITQNLSLNKKVSLSVITVALITGGLISGCGGGGGDAGTTSTTSFTPLVSDPVISGTDLFCNGTTEATSTVASTFDASQVVAVNVSATQPNDPARQNPNANNNLVRLGTISISPVTSGGADATGTTKEAKVHPLLISYAEQVHGSYELGDGSADIGDPTHYDDVFVSLSRDDGQTWKKYQITDSASQGKSSINVTWDGQSIAYPAHSVKPTMVASGNNILVAWHSKYCPSGNPLGLTPVTVTTTTGSSTTTYPDDYFQVNGSQGYIDYGGIVAPNGKTVYQVPFSCIWTARGIGGDVTVTNTDGTTTTSYEITWMKPQQLTSGTRDAAKVTIAESVPGAGSEVGFAITWQEDPEGLRSGKGEGPGEGWSGATTNHGADIWYSMITMDEFKLSEPVLEDNVTKLKPLVNLSYPVRITDNQACKADSTKLYCQELCAKYGSQTVATKKGDVAYCKTGDVDMLTGTQVVLDGDTGASRPLMRIMKSNAGTLFSDPEYVVVLGYEETKGLSSNDGEADQGEDDTDIALEGKSVYFETFKFFKPQLSDTSLLEKLPMVSSGNIINTKVKRETSDEMIYENARRLVLIPQVDPCDSGKYTYGFIYKQGVTTQGESSDMYVRMNTGFGPSTLEAPVNVSSNATAWTTANLSDPSYANLIENTFSPRGLLRGEDLYIAFEYTPDYRTTVQGNTPNNFFIHRYTNGAWQGPQNISQVTGNHISTLDPRMVLTPKGKFSKTGLESDKANPNAIFVTFGTFDMDTGLELDLYYTRSTDKGVTWETVAVPTSSITPTFNLAVHNDIEEKEVQTLSTPDGTRLFNAWLQEDPTYDSTDHFSGVDSWFGVVNYDVPKVVAP